MSEPPHQEPTDKDFMEAHIAALEQQVEGLVDALEHCGYDPTDCIDCGGPPHNEWCRFWRLRDVVPVLFASQEEA